MSECKYCRNEKGESKHKPIENRREFTVGTIVTVSHCMITCECGIVYSSKERHVCEEKQDAVV